MGFTFTRRLFVASKAILYKRKNSLKAGVIVFQPNNGKIPTSIEAIHIRYVLYLVFLIVNEFTCTTGYLMAINLSPATHDVVSWYNKNYFIIHGDHLFPYLSNVFGSCLLKRVTYLLSVCYLVLPRAQDGTHISNDNM